MKTIIMAILLLFSMSIVSADFEFTEFQGKYEPSTHSIVTEWSEVYTDERPCMNYILTLRNNLGEVVEEYNSPWILCGIDMGGWIYWLVDPITDIWYKDHAFNLKPTVSNRCSIDQSYTIELNYFEWGSQLIEVKV